MASHRSNKLLKYGTFDYSSTKRSINFSYGLPDAETFGKINWPHAASADTGVPLADLLQYTDSYGLPELREELSRRYDISRDKVLITSGASQALQLIADAYVNPGDIVLTEDPSYLGALRIFSIAGADIVQLGMNEYGVDIGQLIQVLQTKKKRVSLFYTSSVFHNPTGRYLSQQSMRDIAALLARYDIPLVQDLVYSELPYGDFSPQMLKSGGNVINIHSMSKITGPGMRIGWVLAEEHIIQQLARLKCDGGVSPLLSNMALALLGSAELEAHILWLRRHYESKRNIMNALLRECSFCEQSYSLPFGGFSFWVKIADRVCSAQLIEVVRDTHNVHLTPGNQYGPTSGQYVRLCFSYLPAPRLEFGIRCIEEAYCRLASSKTVMHNLF